MTQQSINVGTLPNDGTGDPARTAFQKVNSNFTELYAGTGSNYTGSGTGAVTRTTVSKLGDLVSVKDFGAKGDGVTDDTAAIRTADVAATAAGASLYFPPGTYAIGTTARLAGMSASWVGAGQNVSVIKSLAGTYTPSTPMVSYANKSNFTISNLGFDMSAATFTSGTAWFLLVFNGTNWSVNRCSFTGIQSYSLGVYANGGSLWSVEDCYFNMAVPTIQANQAINVQAASGYHQICRNVCVGTGIFSNSANGLYSENHISGHKFGGGIVLGPNANAINNRVIGNQCINGAGPPDVNNTYSAGLEIWAPYTTVIGNYCANNSGAGISIGGNNSILADNICINNGQFTTLGAGIIAYTISGYSASNCIIANNTLTDNQGTKTQAYGYAEFGSVGSITGVSFLNNYTAGNLTGATLFKTGAPNTAFASGPVQSAGSIAPVAGGSASCGVQFASTANLGVFAGTGAPTFSAAQGSLYVNTTAASTTTRLYVNTNGSTTWTNVTTAA